MFIGKAAKQRVDPNKNVLRVSARDSGTFWLVKRMRKLFCLRLGSGCEAISHPSKGRDIDVSMGRREN